MRWKNRFASGTSATTFRAGLLATLLVALLDGAGLLDGFERWLYDTRVARCQVFTLPPTDRLVHLDIDDASLESVGRWPWDRATLASVLDEVALAGPAAVGLDVIFSEPQPPRAAFRPDGSVERIDDDAVLAASLGSLTRTLIPASFPFPADAGPPRYAQVRDALLADLELDAADITRDLASRNDAGDLARLAQDVDRTFLWARQSAMYLRIRREAGMLTDPVPDEETLRRRLLPQTHSNTANALTRLVTAQRERVMTARSLERLARPAASTGFWNATLGLAPIPRLAATASATAFVDYPSTVDGVVRWAPLFLEADGYLYPQFGLSLACLTLGVSLEDIEFRSDGIVVPRPDGRLFIPTHQLARRQLEGLADDLPQAIHVPYFGTSDWKSAFARPGDESGARQHVPIAKAWEAAQTAARIRENNRQIDRAIRFIYDGFQGRQELLARHLADPLDPDDWAGQVERARAARREVADDIEFYRPQVDLADPDLLQAFAATQPTPVQMNLRALPEAIKAYDALDAFIGDAGGLAGQLDETRAFLRERLRDKAVLIGYTATSGTVDMVPTPLHGKCPGAVVHGAIFNAVLTGEVWRQAPPWASVLATLAAGVATATAVTRLPPTRGLIACLAMALVFGVVNAVLLFDWGNVILRAAGPIAAFAAVWAAATLANLIVERRQRALIRRRFRTYVDPRLVEYVEHHPERSAFDGERREMTVCFTDLVGFTGFTEKLGEEAVGLLNLLWQRVVPVVRRDGYLNKFLGDGIMFFYGAPEHSPDHAVRAVRAVLDLQEVMRQYHRDVTAPRGLPALGMRIGVSTGPMIVGDAGAGVAASDYTVLGDNVNLGSRLEGANKFFGTDNLVNARTVELAGDAFLFRPIATLRVVGKKQGVEAFHTVCLADSATDRDRRLVDLSRAIVEAYRECRLDAVLAGVAAFDAEMEESKFTSLYRQLAVKAQAGDEPFDPLVTLASK